MQHTRVSHFTASGATRLPIVRQASATECGLACIAMIARYHGAHVDLCLLRRRHESSLCGATLAELVRICNEEGFTTRALTCSVAELTKVRSPSILHWGFDHFVVLKRVGPAGIEIHDPARGVVVVTEEELHRRFTGIVLEVSARQAFECESGLRQLGVADLLPESRRLGARFASAFVLALLCECLFLTTPLYLQAVIDGVVINRDELLLFSLLAAFSVLLLFQVAATVLRGLTFQHLSHIMVFDTAGRVLGHLLRLPLRYFRTRELGDVQHRFQALARIQAFLVNSAPSLLLDALFLLLISALMFRYDARLLLLNLAVVAAWCLWRVASFSYRRRQHEDISRAEANAQTHFLETLRAITSVKSFGGEATRAAAWLDLFAETVSARIRNGNLQILDGAIRQLLFQGARIATIYYLALRALDGALTIGMISAFAAWLGMFAARSNGIVSAVLEYKLLQVPLNRLADIVFHDTEDRLETDGRASDGTPLGRVNITDVSYRYAPNDGLILRSCNANIGPGDFLAIAGPSGSGKSTLLRLLAGIDAPSGGNIRFDDRLLPTRMVRGCAAALFQDDALLRGSLASNIALFDDTADMKCIRRAAKLACIDHEIDRLPMGYHTRVADLGSSLSSGQVQRILLARAFCRNAELLLLDEPTSGLDPDLEKRVVASLRNIDATRVIVTHSDRLLAAADDVLWLRDGTLLSSPPALTVRGE